jgi:predicted Zn-dependent protease
VKNRTLFFKLSAVGLALGAIPLSGCSYWKAHKARVAYGEYQAALGAGDLGTARIALIRLVRTDQDVPDYWLELAKLQLHMGDYRGAYESFAHAHELDRSNVEVLSAMAQMALLSNDIDTANDNARSLALVVPDSPIVTTIHGYVALRSGELDKADAAANTVLAAMPTDSFGKILKARVMIARKEVEPAIALLEDQHRAVPIDRRTMRALVDLYRTRQDWTNLARIQADAHRLDPTDNKTALAAIDAYLRAGNIAAAGKISEPLLAPSADLRVLDQVLSLWAKHEPNSGSLPNGITLARAAPDDQRVAFANYYNRAGKPDTAASLLGGSKLPVAHANARWNAVFAQSLALQGHGPEARRLLDLVLAREPDQVEALRARSALLAQTGETRQAVIDAQRLVTASPDSGDDRLVLAKAFLAAGNRKEVRRTLWQAFQDLPQDERVFSALRSVLASTGDVNGLSRLDDEYKDRRSAKLMKDIV